MDSLKFPCPECRCPIELTNPNLKRTICGQCGSMVWVPQGQTLSKSNAPAPRKLPQPPVQRRPPEKVPTYNEQEPEISEADRQAAEQEAAALEAADNLAAQQAKAKQQPDEKADGWKQHYNQLNENEPVAPAKGRPLKSASKAAAKKSSSSNAALWISIAVAIFCFRTCYEVMDELSKDTSFDSDKFNVPQFNPPTNTIPAVPDTPANQNNGSNFMKSIEESLCNDEAIPDTTTPNTLKRSHFIVDFPGNWSENTEDEEYDPDTYLFLESPGDTSLCGIFVADSLEGGENIWQEKLEQYQIQDTTSTFSSWGQYQGAGYLTTVELLGIRIKLTLFKYTGKNKCFVIVQSAYEKVETKVKPGLDLITSTFEFIE